MLLRLGGHNDEDASFSTDLTTTSNENATFYVIAVFISNVKFTQTDASCSWNLYTVLTTTEMYTPDR